MYHSETFEEKETAFENLTKDSLLRVVVATSALVMGVNVASCPNVIRYGPPKSAVDFLQKTGHVGRWATFVYHFDVPWTTIEKC